MVTAEQLGQIMPLAKKKRIPIWHGPLNNAMIEFGISTPFRMAAFLANVAHESGELLYTREIASGAAYEGRKDLGNIYPGDGKKFPGRGPIEITGRDNYMRAGDALGLPLLDHPELLEDPIHGSRASAWWWAWKGLNQLADIPDFQGICGVINTGNPHTPANRIRGFDDRLLYYNRARRVL